MVCSRQMETESRRSLQYAEAGGVLTGVLFASVLAGFLIGWLAGSAGIGLLIGAVIGIVALAASVYMVYLLEIVKLANPIIRRREEQARAERNKVA